MKTSGCPLRSSVWSCEVVLAPPVDVTSPFPPPLTPVYSLRTAAGSRGEGGLCFPSTTVVINNIFPINPRRLPRENRSSYFLISFNLCPNIPLFLCSAPWPFTSSRGCGRASTTISHTHTHTDTRAASLCNPHSRILHRPTDGDGFPRSFLVLFVSVEALNVNAALLKTTDCRNTLRSDMTRTSFYFCEVFKVWHADQN